MNAVAAQMHDRRTFIGGSDAGAILGLSPWSTPYQVWLEKTGDAKPTDAKKEKIFRRGKKLEPYVLEMLRDEKGITARSVNTRAFDPEFPFMSCEIDAISEDDLEIEIKTVHPARAREWGEEDTDEIPPHYTAQAIHGLMVTGRPARMVAALIGADDLRVYRVERHEDTIQKLRTHELAFWDMVQNRTPPPPVRLEDLDLLYGADKGGVVAVDSELKVLDSIARIRELKSKLKVIANQIEAEEILIKSFMKTAAVLTLDNKQICTWKAHKRSEIDSDRVRSMYPTIVPNVTRVSQVRVFRIA